MARIIGGIGVSHTPTIGFALDQNKQSDPVWAPIFEAFGPVRQWLADRKPDVLFVVYNDHVTSFFFDHYSAFSLGVGDRHDVADEGGGSRALPSVEGHPGLARHIGASMMAEEFDLAFFQNRPLDHGCFSPLSLLWPHDPAWPGKVIPLAVGVLQFPIPTARRCYRFGQALRRAIESYPEDLSVAVIGTGGLSHQVHGERAGFNNTAWDMEFLTRLETDPVSLTTITHAEYAKRGGFEGVEVIMWLVMRGALSDTVVRKHQAYYLPSMTAIAVTLYEDTGSAPTSEAVQRQRELAARELAGVEEIEGTYPFDLERSHRAYRLNRYLQQLTVPSHRAKFRESPEESFAESALSDEERDLIRRRDWRGLMHYGAIFFGLEKLAAVLGLPNAIVYAGMRGEELADFQRMRNAPGALYSVAGRDAAVQPPADAPKPAS